MTETTQANDIFTNNFIDHFTKPRNVGEIENADGYAKVGDPACGDFIQVWIKVENQIIADYKYKVFGCGGAIATTSVASELAIGKHLKQAIKLTDDDVIQTLGGIPENKAHCSLLGINGLRAAIADYLIKDNHKNYAARVERLRQAGFDIPAHREQLVQLLNDLPQNARLLDVGSGKGHLALALARKGWHCISVDKSSEEIYHARLNAIYFQLDEKIEFKQMDAEKLDFPDHTFDVVVSASLFHHLTKPEVVLSEMVRVCHPGGKILIADLNLRGQEILATVWQQDGKEHLVINYKITEIKNWFESKNHTTQIFEQSCETFLLVNLK